MSLEDLKAAFPWPASRPLVAPEDHGWFFVETCRVCTARVDPDTRLIVELGSWLGRSTAWFLAQYPTATVVAVDTWLGGPDHHANRAADPDVDRLLPVLFDKFCANMWPHRGRLVPCRTTTIAGMAAVAAHGLAGDVGLVFIDADHGTEAVAADLAMAWRLFPAAVIVGDDWTWATVRAAVEPFAAAHALRIVVDANAWTLERDRG